jgi:predicted methyltransferase
MTPSYIPHILVRYQGPEGQIGYGLIIRVFLRTIRDWRRRPILREPDSHTSPPITVIMSSRIAQEAHTGFAASSAYDTYRPSYPAEAVSQLLSALKVAGVAGATIADLAAGTGKFTELLAVRPEHYKIIAIEPHDGMREQLEKKKLRGVIVLNGTAENMSEIADGSLDALVVAQVSLPLHTHLLLA